MAPENEDLSTPASVGPSNGAGGAQGPEAPRTGKTQLDLWADQLADYVVQGVAWLKARTTTRAQTALRAIVYGVVILISVIAAFVLIVISLVRIWNVYVPIEPLGRRVWLGYVTIGGLFFIVGAFLLLWKGSGEE
jgi:hypothetical protein